MVARDILLAETRRRALPRGQEPQFTVRWHTFRGAPAATIMDGAICLAAGVE